MPGTKHVEAIIVVRKPTAGRMTRTGEDAAGKNAQTQVSARQPVISSVQRITPDSDGTRPKNAGRRISSAKPKVQSQKLRSPVQTPPISNGSLGPKSLKIGNLVIGGRRSFHRTSRRFSAPPTLPAENTPGKKKISLPYGRAGQPPSRP